MTSSTKVIKVKTSQNSKDILPFYATEGSAGFDICSNSIEDIVIKPFERQLIPTGISVELPDGCEAQVRPRSGLAIKHGVTVLNSPGTIDTDYRGEIKVILINLGQNDFIVKKGERIAQIVVAKYERVLIDQVENITGTRRGEGGFGSTGY